MPPKLHPCTRNFWSLLIITTKASEPSAGTRPRCGSGQPDLGRATGPRVERDGERGPDGAGEAPEEEGVLVAARPDALAAPTGLFLVEEPGEVAEAEGADGDVGHQHVVVDPEVLGAEELARRRHGHGGDGAGASPHHRRAGVEEHVPGVQQQEERAGHRGHQRRHGRRS